MPRIARIVVPGVPHHVTQHGNNQEDVFFTDDDRRLYLTLLADEAQRHGLRVLGYCLMTNHVHLVVLPKRAEALAGALGRVHWRYTQAINRLHGRSGHLWQNRFYSAAMDADHTPAALVYVERNPVRAKICRVARRYPWSSAAAHCGGDDPTGLLDMKWFNNAFSPKEWTERLKAGLDDAEMERIREQTRRGRPLAGDKWIARFESKLNRRLRPLPVGRPRAKRRQGR